jgi:hypothetical protein
MAYSAVDVHGSSGRDKDNLFDEIEDDIDMNDFKIISAKKLNQFLTVCKGHHNIG